MNKNYQITFAGHSTVLIEIDGVRLLTDPLLKRRVAHLGRVVDTPDVESWQIDAVLVSHMHWDHMNLPSLRMLGQDTRIIAPLDTGRFLRRRGFKRVDEIGRDEELQIGEITIRATEANHHGKRPFMGPDIDSLGFLIKGSSEVYFAGDTDLFPEMASLGEEIDVALIPVWGYGPTIGEGHLDPLRAAESLTSLSPSVAVPIHWGTYAPIGLNLGNMSFMHFPPRQFAHHASEVAPDVDVRILEPGATLMRTNGEMKVTPPARKAPSRSMRARLERLRNRANGSS